MSDSAEHATTGAAGDRPPKPVVKRMRWPFPIIWIVPVIAAILAGYYLYKHHQEVGTEISIEFDDATGVTAEQTLLLVRGVPVGRVKRLDLAEDHQRAIVRVRLDTRYDYLARERTAFWIVRPQLSLASVSGLNALVTGPYLEARPGDGNKTEHFKGVAQAPLIAQPGMKFVLHADRIGDVTINSPVTFRGIQVGVVQDIRLSNVADSANITIYIWKPYTVLVRSTTAFWSVKAADIKGSLFSGIKLDVESIRSIFTGSITFATPDKSIGRPAPEMGDFFLNESPRDEWLLWKPKISLTEEPSEAAPTGIVPNVSNNPLPAPQQKH